MDGPPDPPPYTETGDGSVTDDDAELQVALQLSMVSYNDDVSRMFDRMHMEAEQVRRAERESYEDEQRRRTCAALGISSVLPIRSVVDSGDVRPRDSGCGTVGNAPHRETMPPPGAIAQQQGLRSALRNATESLTEEQGSHARAENANATGGGEVNLIEWRDPMDQRWGEQVNHINNLYLVNRQQANPSSVPPRTVSTDLSTVPGSSGYPYAAGNPNLVYGCLPQQLKQFGQPTYHELMKKCDGHQLRDFGPPINAPPLVPFRPLSIRLMNGDLIDLGPASSIVGKGPLTYEEICEEFDPLCIRNRILKLKKSVTNEVKGLPASLSSGCVEQAGNAGNDGAGAAAAMPVAALQRSHSEATQKPGRPPPPKPARLSKPSPRSESADSKQRSVRKLWAFELHLEPYTCEINREMESLRARKQNLVEDWELFVSPVVDYLVTDVTSVKVHVSKDYSWSPYCTEKDQMVFTCGTRTTIGEILMNVLNNFLNPPSGKDQSYSLPINEYGLKIYGLEEFLVNSSLLGSNPFVGHALTYGKDIRMEVGKRVFFKPSRIKERDALGVFDIKFFGFWDDVKWPSQPKTGKGLDVTMEKVKDVISTLQKEHASEENSSSKQKVAQTVKLLCTLLGGIVTSDITSGLERYCSAVTSDLKGHFIFPKEFREASHELALSLHRLIERFCKSTRSDFHMRPLVDMPRAKREVVSIDEKLHVHVESLHNIPSGWSGYTGFSISLHVMHGTSELCRGIKEDPKPITVDFFLPYCRTNTLAAFDLPLCILPRETRIFLLLYGTKIRPFKNGDPKASALVYDEHQLACASISLFDCDGFFRQGSLIVPLAPITGPVVQPWGARPLFENTDDLVAIVNLPEFDYDIFFPPVDFGAGSTKQDFQSLHLDIQQYLLDIVESGVTHSLSQDEKEVMWEKRQFLTTMPEALPLVLASAVGWDWASLNNIYQSVNDWCPLNPVQATELFLPHFPDLIIREKAVDFLKFASSDFLLELLPELVEGLRFETFENSSLATFLLSTACKDRRFAFDLYWLLQQRVDYCNDRPYQRRCEIVRALLLEYCSEQFKEEIETQHLLLKALLSISMNMKEHASDEVLSSMSMLDRLRGSVLKEQMVFLDAEVSRVNVRLPIMPSFLCTGVDVTEAVYMSNSATKPVKIVFKGLRSSYGVLFKEGEDIRQDALVMQLVKAMKDIWLSEDLDLRMIVFRCFSFGNKKGLVEIVPNCRTLREIQCPGNVVTVFKDEKLKKWLASQNPTEFEYKAALENFLLSCAGWCVVTYVLGIGDRHNDNILVTTSGHVFHIDFTRYMGDFQTAVGFKRDRVPFIFTSDMAYVINEGSSQSATSQYQRFIDYCCKAFNLLRKHSAILLNLMKLMSCSDIPGMDMEAVNFVQSNLLLDLTEIEATIQFTRMIEESLNSRFPRLNFFAHSLVQLRNSSSQSRGDDQNKLSFVSQLYTEREEGHIEQVSVLDFEKWHMPDKVYMYKLEVRRKKQALCTILYRSFAEFNELYIKLCRRYPIASLPTLSRGSSIGRSNVRSVAERRRTDIQKFLIVLFKEHALIAHCDLVYTFFHMILRDSYPEEANRRPQPSVNQFPEQSTSVTGSILLKLTFNKHTSILNILVGHVKDLKWKNGQPPDSYVKTYLHPDMRRATKRKTRVVKKTQMPTFNEGLTYQMSGSASLVDRVLEVSVWNNGSLVTENSMIGTVQIPLKRLNDMDTDRKGVKTLDSWFPLNGYYRH